MGNKLKEVIITTIMRRIPILKGDTANKFMEKADRPIPKKITPQEIAIYKVFIQKKKASKK